MDSIMILVIIVIGLLTLLNIRMNRRVMNLEQELAELRHVTLSCLDCTQKLANSERKISTVLH